MSDLNNRSRRRMSDKDSFLSDHNIMPTMFMLYFCKNRAVPAKTGQASFIMFWESFARAQIYKFIWKSVKAKKDRKVGKVNLTMPDALGKSACNCSTPFMR